MKTLNASFLCCLILTAAFFTSPFQIRAANSTTGSANLDHEAQNRSRGDFSSQRFQNFQRGGFDRSGGGDFGGDRFWGGGFGGGDRLGGGFGSGGRFGGFGGVGRGRR